MDSIIIEHMYQRRDNMKHSLNFVIKSNAKTQLYYKVKLCL